MQTISGKIIACIIPLILILATLPSLNVVASPATSVHVDPQDLVDLTLTPGRSFYVNISTLEASDVWGYQAALAYNISVLTATNLSSYDPFTQAYPSIIDNSGIDRLRPNGDGSYRNWTGTYKEWDEATSDGDTTFVSAANASLTQTSALGSPRVDFAWDKIKKVRLVFVARQTVGDEQIVPLLLTEDAVFNGSAVTPPTTGTTGTYEVFSYDWDKNPSTGSRWSWAELEILEVGVKSVQNGPAFDGQIRVTQLFVEVYHEAGFLSATFTKPFGTSTGESGSFPLLKVGFNVTGLGTSILDVFNTLLTTPTSGSITHEETDGMFTNISIHDVVITSVTPSKKRITAPGEVLTVDVTVANPGDFNETFNLILTYDGNLIDNQTDIFLNIDENTTLTFDWDTTGLADAEYTIRAQAVLSFLDNHPDDNTLDAKVRIGVIRDVGVLSVTPLPSEVYRGESVLITVTVRNQGNFTESFSIIIGFADNTTAITTEPVSNLPAGQSTPVSYNWETADLTEGSYVVRAEVIAAIDDNPTNNVAESIPVKVGAGGFPVTWTYAGIALIAIIILLIVVYIIRKIRKRKPEQPTV